MSKIKLFHYFLIFSNKLNESEAMSSVAVLRAQTVSRMAMSPSHDKNDELMSILQSAKEDLKKEKKMKV